MLAQMLQREEGVRTRLVVLPNPLGDYEVFSNLLVYHLLDYPFSSIFLGPLLFGVRLMFETSVVASLSSYTCTGLKKISFIKC